MALLTRYFLLDGVIVLSSFIILLYLYMTRKFKYWKNRGVLEVTPTPFIGNFGDCLTTKISAGQWIDDIYNYGAGLPYVGLYIFDRPCLLIRDREIIKSILVRDFNYFQNRFVRASPDDPIGDMNLFMIKNPAWKIIRTKLTPIYTTGRLKRMFELMVEITDDLDVFMKQLNLSGKGDTVEVKEICAKFTTDMIATTAFGLKVNSLNNPEAEFRKTGRKIFAQSLYRNFEIISMFFMPEIVKPLHLKFMSKECSDYLRKTLWEVILERERSGIKRNDLIDLLVELRQSYLESTDKGVVEFDGDTLVAQASVFFTAGFETSSSILSFALYELALQPDIQTKLRSEINEALEQSGGKITYDLTTNLTYLDMVVSETLRKYPTLPFLDRVANEDYKIPNSDLVLKKGTPVFIPMTGIHNDPEYYPDPKKFDPERFSIENKGARVPFTYFPFGEGPRACIGLRIGLLQTKIGLIKLLSGYEFSPCKETMIPMRLSTKALFTAADGGIFLNAKQIQTM